MRALAGRSAGAIGHGNEARLERLESLDRLPQRLRHLFRLRRKEFEADLDVAAGFREQRTMMLEAIEGVHAALRCRTAAFTPRHNVTVSSPPPRCSTWSVVRPAEANHPAITSSSKPRRMWASVARSSSRSCAAKSTTSNVPPGASTRDASAIAAAGECA